ncbi:hypothetical protein EJB05_43529, partial [Eragrostis curvula]
MYFFGGFLRRQDPPHLAVALGHQLQRARYLRVASPREPTTPLRSRFMPRASSEALLVYARRCRAMVVTWSTTARSPATAALMRAQSSTSLPAAFRCRATTMSSSRSPAPAPAPAATARSAMTKAAGASCLILVSGNLIELDLNHRSMDKLKLLSVTPSGNGVLRLGKID